MVPAPYGLFRPPPSGGIRPAGDPEGLAVGLGGIG